jgi:hypothetical protein
MLGGSGAVYNLAPVAVDFDKSIMKYPSITRFPGGASSGTRTPQPIR